MAAILPGSSVLQPLLQLERTAEGRLHRHLLVEREADEERERLAGEQLVRFVDACVVEAVGMRRRHEADPTTRPRALGAQVAARSLAGGQAVSA